MTRVRNESGQKRLVLLGQIGLPSGDKTERLGGNDSMPTIYLLFGTIVDKEAMIKNRYNRIPHPPQKPNGKGTPTIKTLLK